VVRPLKAGPASGLAATERDRAADGRSGPDGIELLDTSFGACPAHLGRGRPRRGALGQRKARVRRGSGREQRRQSSGTLGRPARPEPSSARQHQASTGGVSEPGTRAAELIQ